MRFGFAALPVGPPAETVALFRIAEDLGFSTGWMPDQTFYRDPYVTLAACAQGTTRITLGLGVTNPTTRHPVMTARAAATLAELSDGRFILGLGAGNRKELLDLLDLPTDHAATRCREAAVAIRRLLAGERVDHHGPTLTIRGVALEMTSPPPVPVYLAARGPEILRVAGEVADGVIIGALVSEPGLRFALDHVRTGAQRAGRTLQALEVVSWVTTIVTDRKVEALEWLRPTVAHIVGGAPPEVLRAIGLPTARIAAFKEAYAAGGPQGAAPLVDPPLADALTIVGPPEEIAERILALSRAGVRHLTVLMPGGRGGTHAFPDFDRRKNLRRIAEEVIPRVAA